MEKYCSIYNITSIEKYIRFESSQRSRFHLPIYNQREVNNTTNHMVSITMIIVIIKIQLIHE